MNDGLSSSQITKKKTLGQNLNIPESEQTKLERKRLGENILSFLSVGNKNEMKN